MSISQGIFPFNFHLDQALQLVLPLLVLGQRQQQLLGKLKGKVELLECSKDCHWQGYLAKTHVAEAG